MILMGMGNGLLVSFNDYSAILFGHGAGNNVKTSTYNALTGNDGTDLLMGDFDGDGKDEIIGVDGNRLSSFIFL